MDAAAPCGAAGCETLPIIYLVVVLLHCVAAITPSYTVITTLMNVAVSCILLMKRQLLSRYDREHLGAIFNTSFLYEKHSRVGQHATSK